MATATKTTRGFEVTCPFCSDRDATITLDLNDLGVVTCSSCDEQFSAEAAVARVAEDLRRWESLARWIALADPK